MLLDWDAAGALAEQLHSRYPGRDPLTIRFPDLERWCRELPGFAASGSPAPAALESIQAAWHLRFEAADRARAGLPRGA